MRPRAVRELAGATGRPAAPAAGRTLSLFVFIDALGWEVSQREGAFRSLLPWQQPLETVFGYSSTCDPTILTGVAPREHGHFTFFRYNPERSPFKGHGTLARLPRWLTSRARVRRLISRVSQRRLGYTGYFQLYNVAFQHLPLLEYTERHDLYEPGGINGGQPTVFDRFRAAGLPVHRSDWRRGEAENVAAALAAVRDGSIRVAYLYLAGLDGVMHALGTRDRSVGQRIRWYEEQVAALMAEARLRYDEVSVSAFSDHGMTDVRETCDLRARIDATGLRFGTDYAAVFDSTMARFWFLRSSARQRIETALREESRGRILSEADLAGFGCDFPGQSYGQLYFLLDPGVLLCPSDMGERPIRGMHGYDPSDRDSTAFFASNQAPDPAPRRLADLHDFMLQSSGLAAR
ncbi:MAG TPA: alkaline phosphatase family protein [Gemmatimonadales bacterium]